MALTGVGSADVSHAAPLGDEEPGQRSFVRTPPKVLCVWGHGGNVQVGENAAGQQPLHQYCTVLLRTPPDIVGAARRAQVVGAATQPHARPNLICVAHGPPIGASPGLGSTNPGC